MEVDIEIRLEKAVLKTSVRLTFQVNIAGCRPTTLIKMNFIADVFHKFSWILSNYLWGC